MKKIFLLAVFLIFGSFVFAQSNAVVDLNDEVYEVLQMAEMRGLISPLYTMKPYTEKYIKEKLSEALDTLGEKEGKFSETEKKVVTAQFERFKTREAGFKWSSLSTRIENEISGQPVSIEGEGFVTSEISSGFYDKSSFNSTSTNVYLNAAVKGDMTKWFSYYVTGYMGLVSVPELLQGTYDVGFWWYDEYMNGYQGVSGNGVKDKNGVELEADRKINKYKIWSVMPYSFKKTWDGSLWHLSNFSATGMEGWPSEESFIFVLNGGMNASFLNDAVSFGFGRVNREWGSMDNGASLVLNPQAHMIMAFDTEIRPFKWMSISAMTGALEHPNSKHVTNKVYIDGDEKNYAAFPGKEFGYFQNLYSIGEFDLDFKYFHFDFGSTVVWPKRLDFGYINPFMENTAYQNNIGDIDNMALYGNIMLRNPGIWKGWISGFLDEMPKPNPKKMFKMTRYMFAMQAGVKVVMPFLPFTDFSVRYTKIEPYCYTHQAINYSPFNKGYLSQAYMSNGEGLGYYLPPNSDEFHLRFESRPFTSASVALQYQLIRHGADYGTRQVRGSSLYSELPPGDKNKRDAMFKYFLQDGCYNWTNILSISGSYNFKSMKVPVSLNMNMGWVYDYYTDILQPNGNVYPIDYSKAHAYKKIDTEEYPTTNGFVMSVGVTILGK